MIYVIANTVEYDEGALELKCCNTDDFINLTMTSSRLLTLLIKHQGDIVSRESIFEVVWDAYEKRASNSNLNQYISILRKNFLRLGVEKEVIITVPRVGFMVSNDVNITFHPGGIMTDHEVVTPELVEKPQPRPSLATKKNNDNTKPLTYLVLGYVLLVFMAITAFDYFDTPKLPDKVHNNSLHIIDTYDKCNFYSIGDIHAVQKNSLRDILNHFNGDVLASCKNGIYADVFVTVDEMYHSTNRNRYMLTICQQNESREYKYCNNIVSIVNNTSGKKTS